MDETGNPMERRLVLRLLKYWREVSGGDGMPSESAIDPDAISDMWPHCAILGVAGHADDPMIIKIGDELARSAGGDCAGKPVSALPAETLAANGLAYFRQILEKRVPITYGGEFTESDGAKILFRSIILPLSEDGSSIDHLLAAANCKQVTEE